MTAREAGDVGERGEEVFEMLIVVESKEGEADEGFRSRDSSQKLNQVRFGAEVNDLKSGERKG